MSYVDGFIIAVPQAGLDQYKQIARRSAEIWMSHGATAYYETLGDDVPYGEVTSFPRAVQLEEGEVVVFSWIVYPSKEVRDACNAKVMADPLMATLMPEMEATKTDMKRMIFGGFVPFVEA